MQRHDQDPKGPKEKGIRNLKAQQVEIHPVQKDGRSDITVEKTSVERECVR
jgi:hypothetical protein